MKINLTTVTTMKYIEKGDEKSEKDKKTRWRWASVKSVSETSRTQDLRRRPAHVGRDDKAPALDKGVAADNDAAAGPTMPLGAEAPRRGPGLAAIVRSHMWFGRRT